MADREESIHVKIHLELSEEDEAELKQITGTLDDASKSPVQIKKDKEIKETVDLTEMWKTGNVGAINNFTTQQFNNVKSMASAPAAFIFRAFAGKVGRAASLIGLGLIIFEIVKWIFDEMMLAGRYLDRRFRRLAQEEVLGFMSRKEQQELRQGFKDIRVTTQQGLRGGAGQVYGNLFAHSEVYGSLSAARTGMIAKDVVVTSAPSHGFATDSNGNPRGGHRTGGGAGK